LPEICRRMSSVCSVPGVRKSGGKMIFLDRGAP
jgi:hypothetical protein